MTLGDIVNKYRTEHNMSMDGFAQLSGLSKGYISMLEKNEHPKTKLPIAPTIDTFRAVARAVGVDWEALISSVDADQPIAIKNRAPTQKVDKKFFSPLMQKIVKAADNLNDNGKKSLLDIAEGMQYNPKYKKQQYVYKTQTAARDGVGQEVIFTQKDIDEDEARVAKIANREIK